MVGLLMALKFKSAEAVDKLITKMMESQPGRFTLRPLVHLPEDTSFRVIGAGFGNFYIHKDMVVFATTAFGDEAMHKYLTNARPDRKLNAIEGLVFAMNPPSLGQSRSNSDIELTIKSSGAELEDFRRITQELAARMRDMPGLVNVDTDLRVENPQLDIRIDREQAADLGISAASVADALRLLVAEGPADDFVLRNKQYDVVMALARQYRSFPEQLDDIHVRTGDGSMVPLSTIAEAVPVIGPATLNHYDLQRSASVSANLMPGATLGDTLPQVLGAADEILPAGFSTALGGQAREFVESGRAVYLTFAAALLVIFLVLAAQFESFLHPFTVMLAVPLACLGALATLMLLGHTLNIFSGIGIILLVGLVTKNSILLVDFANQERARGTELVAALAAAGRTRFRPILMTSMTSILGAIPLALAVGAGAESRRPIGAAVVGGLLFSTFFTLLVVPAIHVLVIRLGERLGLKTIPPLVELEMEVDSAAAGPEASQTAAPQPSPSPAS